ICDDVDKCQGGDDAIDSDGDGQPDFCDCAPVDPDAWTGAPEICDGLDNNCDAVIDPRGSVGATPYYLDADGDGYGTEEFTVFACTQPEAYSSKAGDCDDNRWGINPDSKEYCGDGFDNNCDGKIDEGCPTPKNVDGSTVSFGCAGCASGNPTPSAFA